MTWLARWAMVVLSAEFLTPLVLRICFLLGGTLFTWTASNLVFSFASGYIAGITGLPGFAVWFLVNSGLAQAANIIWSSFVTAAAFQGLNAVRPLTRWVWRGPVGTV